MSMHQRFNKIEAGYKGTFSRQESPVETKSGETAETPGPTNNFTTVSLIDQDIHALYATYSGRFGNFGYQAGLRGEYSHTDTRSLAYGQEKGEVSPYKDDYFSIFPSVFLTYTLPAQNEIQIELQPTVIRPWGIS